jgi:hypothetical protein
MDDRKWAALRGGPATWLALTIGDGAALALLRPAPHALAGELAHPQRWVARVGADHAAATLAGAALWLAAAWLGLGLLAALAGRLPGAAGALSRRVAGVALPRALYRAAVGAAGLGVLLSPVAASAAGAHPGATHPGTPNGTLSAPRLPASTLPAPVLPRSPSTRPPGARRPAPPPRGSRSPGTQKSTAQAAAVRVSVRAGDSLWRIAAEHLPKGASERRVAAAWPRWFAANREVIGADPDLIVPGEVLRAPGQIGRPAR